MAITLNTVARANLRASKKKYILTGIGISISAFFIAAVIVLVSSLQGTINASVGDILTKVDNVVISAGSNDPSNGAAKLYLDEEAIKKIQDDPSVEAAWAQYQGQGKFGPDKVGVYYSQAPTSASLFPFPIEGKLPATDAELMISKIFAEKHNLKAGDKVSSQDIVASVPDPTTADTKEYTITGIFDGGFSGSSSNNAIFIGGTSYGEAAEAALKNNDSSVPEYSIPGASMVYVKFRGDDQNAARAELQKKLNTGDQATEPKVMTGNEYLKIIQKQLSTMFAFIGVILGAFAALALLVSSFVISNTFAVLVGQRVRELALLRTLGARGASLVWMLLIEALIVGVVFSAIGAALVYVVAAALSSVFNNILISYNPMAFVAGVVLCTIVTVLASLVPARTALRISPISAMSENTNQAVKKPGIIGLILGAVAAVSGVALVILALNLAGQPGDSGGQSAVLLIMLAALILGIAVFLLTPWLLLPLVRVVGAALRSQTGRLAVENALRSPKRTVSTGRAVLVGSLVVATVLTGYSIINASVAQAMDKAYPISAMATYGRGTVTGLVSVNNAHSVADKVKGIKHVEAAAVASAAGTLEYTSTPEGVSQPVTRTENLVALNPDDVQRIIPSEDSTRLTNDTVLVPSAIYDAGHFDDSTRLKATGPLGAVELKPIKSETKQPLFIVTTDTGAKVQNAADPQPVTKGYGAGATGAEGSGAADSGAAQQNAVSSQVQGSSTTGAETLVLVRATSPLSSADNSALQDALTKANDGNEFSGGLVSRKQIDQILTVLLGSTLALLALAIVISIIGVANTMTLSVNERRRENAVLRSLGLSRSQLRRMISVEAILITLGAVVLGILAGVSIGIVSAQVMLSATSGSAEMVVALPFGWLLVVVLVGLVSALAASALPAARSARLSPVQGLRS